eukprot:5206188-Pyramimonas_sp.AAC.1
MFKIFWNSCLKARLSSAIARAVAEHVNEQLWKTTADAMSRGGCKRREANTSAMVNVYIASKAFQTPHL